MKEIQKNQSFFLYDGMRKKVLLIGFLLSLSLICSPNIFAQNLRKVTGVIMDDKKEPLTGATIAIKGTSIGAVADLDGSFSIDIPTGKQRLTISLIGMKTQEVEINDQKHIVVVMEDNEQMLSEVLVVGFGRQKKESVVGAISQAKGEVLERTGGVSSLGAALTGNIPGLVTTTSTGMPGQEDPNILIRAQTTWNNSSPLILVDGVERLMSDVDINSVESVSVLKDASATAVFGVRGANGVILITTKRGTEGKTRIDIGVSTTLKTISKLPNKYDAYDALMLKNRVVESELARNPEAWAYITPQEQINLYRNQSSLEQRERYPNIDWVDYLFNDFAMSYNANINVSGGTKFVKYFAAVDYLHEGDLFKTFDGGTGYTANFAYDRLNTRTNLDFQLTNSTIFKVNLFGSYAIRSSPGGVGVDGAGNYLSGAYNMSPDIFYPQYADKSWGYYHPDDSYRTQNSAKNLANAGEQQKTDTRFSTDFILNQDLTFITKGLSAQGTISFDQRFREVERGIHDTGSLRQKWIDPKTGIEYIPSGQLIDNNTQFDWVPDVVWAARAGKMESWSTYRSLNYNVQLNYEKTLDKVHNFTAMGNFMRQESSRGSDIPSYREDWVFRTTYNYDSRYFVDYNGAYNGTEKFASGYRFGFFSSGAIGWMVSNEKFMKNIKFLDMLKLRASYGQVGDDSGGGRFIYMDGWSYEGSAKLGLTPGAGESSPYTWYKQTQVGNPQIRWERVTKKNFAVEYSILKGLFAGAVDIFKDERKDILMSGDNRSVPSYFGVKSPTANLGKVKGTGYEIELRFRKNLPNQMLLSVDASLTHAENTVLDADDPQLYPHYMKKAGYPNGQPKSHISNGYYNTMDELYGSTPFESNDNKNPGFYNIMDYNGDGVIDDKDNVPYGYSGNPQNTYNLRLGFDWKGFSAMVQFYGVTNATRNVTLTSFQQPYLNTAYDIGSLWSRDNANADSPLPKLISNIQDSYVGDRFMYDGSYIRLKNAEVAYTFTSDWIKKIGLNSLRLYLSGNNIWMWSRMPDDRESSMAGGVWVSNTSAYPTAKRFTLGLKVTL